MRSMLTQLAPAPQPNASCDNCLADFHDLRVNSRLSFTNFSGSNELAFEPEFTNSSRSRHCRAFSFLAEAARFRIYVRDRLFRQPVLSLRDLKSPETNRVSMRMRNRRVASKGLPWTAEIIPLRKLANPRHRS